MSVAFIDPPPYQARVFFVGSNGSGKSFLASHMLQPYPRVYVLDVKGDFRIPWAKGTYQIRTLPPWHGLVNAARWRYGKQRIVYRPEPPYDDGSEVGKFFDWAFRKARSEKGKVPRILYVDEGAWVSYAGAWRSLARLVISTRSLNLGVWLAAQRPKGIPVEVRSEAWVWYVFYLRSREDRKEIVSYLDYQVTEQEFESSTEDYEFWEIRRGEGGHMSYRQLPPVAQLPARRE